MPCNRAFRIEPVFINGRWKYEAAGSALRSLHYIAGGPLYAIGEALDADTRDLISQLGTTYERYLVGG